MVAAGLVAAGVATGDVPVGTGELPGLATAGLVEVPGDATVGEVDAPGEAGLVLAPGEADTPGEADAPGEVTLAAGGLALMPAGAGPNINGCTCKADAQRLVEAVP